MRHSLCLTNPKSPAVCMRSFYSLKPTILRLKYDYPSPMKVLHDSPLGQRKAVEEIAYHFKREGPFDFVQFEASETPGSAGYVPWEAYLFHERVLEKESDHANIRIRCFGACCFRWRDWTNRSACWTLDWVWFHPYFRHQGNLTNAWRKFKQEHGDFLISQPPSPSMKAFLQKVER